MSEIRRFSEHLIEIHLSELVRLRESDAMAIYGPMIPALLGVVRTEVESLSRQENFNRRLTVVLNTGGGLVDAVERTIDVIRYHYNIVDFIIRDQAMSAGTVTVHTDEMASYKGIDRHHETVNHSAGEHVRDDVTVNGIEGYMDTIDQTAFLVRGVVGKRCRYSDLTADNGLSSGSQA